MSLIIKYGPLILILTLTLITSHSTLFTIDNNSFINKSIYILLCFSFLTIYYLASTTNPGYIPKRTNSIEEGLYHNDEGYYHEWQRKSDGSRRFCRKCRLYKPDRSHHCSTCNRCIYKMDHHCPWLLNKCVGFHNYKLFLLLLLYSSLLCLFSFAITFKSLYYSIANNESPSLWYAQLEWSFVIVETFILGFALLGFLIWHLTLVSSNKTTIEALENDKAHRTFSPKYLPPPTSPSSMSLPPPPPSTSLSQFERSKLTQLALVNIFDRGFLQNFKDVLGWDSRLRFFGFWVWFTPSLKGSYTEPNTFIVENNQGLKVKAIRTELDIYWHNF